MYDINRSNLLSTKTLILYLYDILLLEKFNEMIKAKTDSLELAKRQVKLSADFDAAPYRKKSEKVFRFTWYVLYTFICFIGITMLAFIAYDISSLLNYQIDFSYDSVLFFAMLLISAALAFIPFIFRWQIIRKDNLCLMKEEELAKQKYEENEIYRLENERKLLSRINMQINHLYEKSSYINQWVKQLYDFDILQPQFHNPEICSYFFQLFDTEEVTTLEQAEALYEALCSQENTDNVTPVPTDKTDILTDPEHLECLFRCVFDNAEETRQILEGISMNGEYIAGNTAAMEINSEIININTNTLILLQELGLLA